jgi:membrane protein implicated in regulation of membrane protease activity
LYLARRTNPINPRLGILIMVLNPAIAWLVAGTLLCLVEVFVPTAFTAFAMGLSAFLVALVAKLLPNFLALQVGLWMVFSLTFVYLTHRLMPKRKVTAIEDATEAQTLTEILPGETGRVIYEGNSWRARCGDEKCAIAPNQKVYVIGRVGTTLIVMPEHLLHS